MIFEYETTLEITGWDSGDLTLLGVHATSFKNRLETMSIKADLVEFKMSTESFKAQVWSLTLSAVFGGSTLAFPFKLGGFPCLHRRFQIFLAANLTTVPRDFWGSASERTPAQNVHGRRATSHGPDPGPTPDRVRTVRTSHGMYATSASSGFGEGCVQNAPKKK